MKKVSIISTVVLSAALLLAACTGGNNTQPTPTDGTIPQTGSTPTLMATEPVVATATEAAPEATATVDTAPTEVVEPAVDLRNSPDRFSTLFDFDVRTANGDKIGEVEGVIVQRSPVVSEDFVDNRGDLNSTAVVTPDPLVTSTPAATTGDNTVTTTASGEGAARVLYVVVELDDFIFNNGAAAVDTPAAATATPDAANPLPAATQTVTGLAGNDVVATGSLTAGDEILLPLSAFQPLSAGMSFEDWNSDPALVLTVDPLALVNAPRFDRDLFDFTLDTWDADYRAFYNGLGVVYPDFAEMPANSNVVLFDDSFGDINAVNAENDDIGEVEEFIIDPATGEFRYAILATGGFLGLGERHIPVPMELVTWVADNVELDGTPELDDVGHVMINVTGDAFDNAPTYDAVDRIDTTVSNWDDEVRAYWQSFVNSLTR